MNTIISKRLRVNNKEHPKNTQCICCPKYVPKLTSDARAALLRREQQSCDQVNVGAMTTPRWRT